MPELAGWRRERMPEPPGTPAITIGPDWVCEILSPSTQATDRAKKMPVYAREGVGHLWLVDPVAKTLEIYRLESSRWMVQATFAGDETVRAEPFDAIELELSLLWAW